MYVFKAALLSIRTPSFPSGSSAVDVTIRIESRQPIWGRFRGNFRARSSFASTTSPRMHLVKLPTTYSTHANKPQDKGDADVLGSTVQIVCSLCYSPSSTSTMPYNNTPIVPSGEITGTVALPRKAQSSIALLCGSLTLTSRSRPRQEDHFCRRGYRAMLQ